MRRAEGGEHFSSFSLFIPSALTCLEAIQLQHPASYLIKFIWTGMLAGAEKVVSFNCEKHV